MKTTLISLLTASLIVSAVLKSHGQISGETFVVVNSTHTYTYYSSQALANPIWYPHHGNLISEWQTGDHWSGYYYHAEVQWTIAGSGGIEFANYSQPLATLYVEICSQGGEATVSLPPSLSICSGLNVQISATATNGGSNPTYVWKINGVTKQSGNSYWFNTSELALNDVVSVTLTSSDLCLSDRTDIAQTTVTQATQPFPLVVDLTGPSSICSNDAGEVTFNAMVESGGGSNPTFTWYKNGGLADNTIQGNTSVYDPYYPVEDGDLIYCVVTSSATCISGNATVSSNIIEISIQSAVTPWVEIEEELPICLGDPVTFTAHSSHPITSYSWSMGSTTSTQASFSPTAEMGLQAPGRTINLSVGVSGSCLVENVATAQPFYQVVDAPSSIGIVTVDATSFCGSGTVNFSLSHSTGTVSWNSRYKDGDGEWSIWSPFYPTSGNIGVNNDGISIRTYEFQAFAKNGACDAVPGNIVEAKVYPSSQIGQLTANEAQFCGSSSVDLALSSFRGDLTWRYRFKDGDGAPFGGWTVFSTEESHSLTTPPLSSGGTIERIYEIQVQAQSGVCQPTSWTSTTVTIHPPSGAGTLEISPGVEFYGDETPELTLSQSGSMGVVTYQLFTGVDWVNTSSPLIVEQSTQFRIEAESGNCPPDHSIPSMVSLFPVPVVISTEGVNYLTYGSQLELFTANYYWYQWMKDGADIPNSNQQYWSASSPGVYSVRVKGSPTAPEVTSMGFVVHDNPLSTQNYNFVSTTTFLKAGVDPSSLYTIDPNYYAQSTTYFDGLGRPMQTVVTKGSPMGFDVVEPIAYDGFGREANKYLAYVAPQSNGWYRPGALSDPETPSVDPLIRYRSGEQFEFYQGTINVAQDTFPYAQNIFEASPLNRVVEEGSPGAAWQPGEGTTVEREYLANVAEEVWNWRYLPPTSNQPLGLVDALSSYDVSTLFKNVKTDAHGKDVIEYKDKQGRVVLKRVQASDDSITGEAPTVDDTNYASTYYIYDTFGNLVCVIQPEGVKNIAHYFNANDQGKDDFLARWAFRYRYDGRKRMIMKQIPGAEPVFMVYDNRDRLVLTQDGKQRSASPYRWSFTKYDRLNRPILTGIMDTTGIVSQADMQAAVNAHYATANAVWGETFEMNGPIHGYSNKTFPLRTTDGMVDPHHYLTVTYYDDYSFRNGWIDDYSYSDENLSETVHGVLYQQPDDEFLRVVGRVTGSKVKVLDGGIRGRYTWLKSVNYYDEKYRVIQTVADNYKGGQDRMTRLYDFVGKVLKTKTEHTTNEVSWADLVNTIVVGNTLVKTATGAGWTAGAVTNEQLPAGADGWIECVITEPDQKRAFGLTETNEGQHRNTIDYAFWHDGTSAAIFENGSLEHTLPGPVKAGDVVRISRGLDDFVRYYVNDALVYTSETASTTVLVGDASIDSGSGNILVPRASFNSKADSVERRFVYDHAGRLTDVWHQINVQPEVRIVYNEYNELSQLVDKKLHSTQSEASDAVQSIDYRYNIRGWLTDMNAPDLGEPDAGEPSDYFGFQLAYNEVDAGIGNTGMFNGNISAMKWSSNLGMDEEKMRGYKYGYDALNRITAAEYKRGIESGGTISWSTPADSSFSVNKYSYDLNGNILGLRRKGKDGNDLDILKYEYGVGSGQSNQLLKVTDTGSKTEGFTERVSEGDDYVYDANGNLIWDKNKGGEEILTNGDFTMGGSNWVVNDPSGRLTFADDSLKITSHATASATLRQNDIILRRAAYVVIVDLVREAGSITINVGSGGNTSINTSGKTVLSCKSVSGNDFVVTIPRTFSGRINSIEVKGIVVIDYNFLNLPEYVSKGPQQQLGYIYDATGRKISQELYNEAGQVVKKSDYAGEFFYENDTLRFIDHEEGRAVMKDGVPEYQYHLKDHLGNVRLTFTTEPETETFTATLEEGTQAEEAGNFNNYNPTDWDLFDHTDSGSVYTYSQLLHGGHNSQVGLAKSFSVMPGDTLRAEVYAKYHNVSDDAGNLLGFAAALTSAFGLTGSMTGDPGTAFDVLDSYGALIADGVVDHSDDPSAPKAYLNILLFDRDHNLVDAAYDQIDVSKMQGSDPALKNDHDHLNEELVVSEAGYVYIFLSNENPTQVDVYFDDLKVEHVKSPVVQMDDYYPFGLTFNSYQRENSVDQRWKFQGQEHIDDLGLNWDSFKWRNHQPDIGRFFNVDPLAEDYYYNSPYAFSENKVIAHREIEGLEAESIHYTNPTEEASAAVAEGIATDLFGLKHSIYNVILGVAGSDMRATFVQNEDGDYETGFVETEESTGEYFVNLGLDLLNLASFGKGPGAIFARTAGKNSIVNNGRKTFKQIQEDVRLEKEKALQKQQQQQKQQQKAEQAKAKQKQGSAEHTKNKRGSTKNKHETGQSRKQADQERSNNPNKKKPQQ